MSSELGSNYLYVNSLYIQNLIANLQKVGGKIFYIDTSSTNTYTFYNSANFSAASAPSVGSDYSNYYYTKTGTDYKDKYYVYYTTKFTLPWGYDGFIATDGGTVTVLESIGTGRTTSEGVLGTVDKWSSGQTMWRFLSKMRAGKLNGCSDWYIGSEDELTKLKDEVGASTMYNCWTNRDYGTETAMAYTSNKGWYPVNKDSTSGWFYLIRSF